VSDAYWAIIAASLSATLVAVAVALWGLADSLTIAVLAAATLVLSKWWVDYSTSGLENPLLFVFAAWFVALWNR
jgi:arabinofuranosyltransferase